MKQKKSAFSGLLKGLLTLALISSPSLSAQEDDNNDIYEISPFQVDGSGDAGYLAGSTLAVKVAVDLAFSPRGAKGIGLGPYRHARPPDLSRKVIPAEGVAGLSGIRA